MLTVLGFDPGSVHVGWGALNVRGDRGIWRSGGENRLDGDVTTLLALYESTVATFNPDLIVIEVPESEKAHGEGDAAKAAAKSKTLMGTSRIGGILEGMCLKDRRHYIKISPAEWKQGLVGNARANDAAVKNMLRLRVQGLPSVTNPHLRDACGSALFGGLKVQLSKMRSPTAN